MEKVNQSKSSQGCRGGAQRSMEGQWGMEGDMRCMEGVQWSAQNINAMEGAQNRNAVEVHGTGIPLRRHRTGMPRRGCGVDMEQECHLGCRIEAQKGP